MTTLTAAAAPPIEPREHLRQLLWALLRARLMYEAAWNSAGPVGLRAMLDHMAAGHPTYVWSHGDWQRTQ